MLPIFLLLGSCGRDKEETLKEEAKARLSALHTELQSLTTRQEVSQKKESLEKKFFELVQAMIALRENGSQVEPFDVQKEILWELERLYQIDGCLELIESAEEPALEALDRYEHDRELKMKKRESSLR
jgi:hypothetical protein